MKNYLLVLLLLSMSHLTSGQNYAEIPITTTSGTYDGSALASTLQSGKPHGKERTRLKTVYKTGRHYLAFSTSVSHNKAFAVRFDNAQLGKTSFIYLENTNTGNYQYFDQAAINDYDLITSEFLPGNIKIELYVSAEDENISFRLQSLMIFQNSAFDYGKSESICNDDEREASDDPAVGRTNRGCTAWIVSNGAILSAGHCADDNNLTRVDFNVPRSNADGSNNFPPQSDRYTRDVIWWENGSKLGDDWAVFTCHPNGTTGLTPIQAQNAFYRMSKDHNPLIFRITGFGDDDGADDNSQQTSLGFKVREVSRGSNRVYWRHKVDTEPGNSGSPIIIPGTSTTVGIHTNGGCGGFLGSGNNKGTSFESNDLEATIHDVLSVGLTGELLYVDNGDIVTSENGGVLRPYSTVSAAVSAVSSGGTLSIVAGNYPEELHITKALTILAPPVGTVTIGPGASAIPGSIANPGDIYGLESLDLTEDPNNLSLEYTDPDELELSHQELANSLENILFYPNPFAESISIENIDSDHLKSIKIMDLSGRVLQSYSRNQLQPFASKITLDTQNLGDYATYLLEIKTSNGTHKQLIKRMK